jgi:hypothetical protein
VAANVIDRSVKALARLSPQAFVKVALGETQGVTAETIENPEINLPERRLDFVYGLRWDDEECLLHLEFQMEHEPDVPKRMFTYNALLTAGFNKPVISAVIYLERREYRHLPQDYAVFFAGQPVNNFRYRAVKLWDYAEAIGRGELRELAPLLILLTREKGEGVLTRTKHLILTAPDARWRADALSVAVTVAGRYFPREFLLKFFREELAMLRDAGIVQDWINEGIEKGRLQGQIATLQSSIIEVLTERFGVIKKGLSQKLAEIDDPAVLRSLLRKSTKVESLEEFIQVLEEV